MSNCKTEGNSNMSFCHGLPVVPFIQLLKIQNKTYICKKLGLTLINLYKDKIDSLRCNFSAYCQVRCEMSSNQRPYQNKSTILHFWSTHLWQNSYYLGLARKKIHQWCVWNWKIKLVKNKMKQGIGWKSMARQNSLLLFFYIMTTNFYNELKCFTHTF